MKLALFTTMSTALLASAAPFAELIALRQVDTTQLRRMSSKRATAKRAGSSPVPQALAGTFVVSLVYERRPYLTLITCCRTVLRYQARPVRNHKLPSCTLTIAVFQCHKHCSVTNTSLRRSTAYTTSRFQATLAFSRAITL